MRVVLTWLAPLLVVLGAFACDDPPTPQPCTDIPQGGCPLSYGVACEDPACAAVYACREGNRWELDHTCPPRSVPEGGVTVNDAGSDANDAGTAFDAAIDAPPGAYGGPGCGSLQAPDCSLGVALACGADCCGCEDLYVCANGGWDLWGACGDGGISPR